MTHMIRTGRTVFELRTPEEAQRAAAEATAPCGASWTLEAALAELLANAIEHGNLQLGFRRKSALIEAGNWEAELARRLAAEPYASRTVRLTRERAGNEWIFEIGDEGEGFDWRRWLEPDPRRSTAPNGRGIALARELARIELCYLGCGNRVRFSVAAR